MVQVAHSFAVDIVVVVAPGRHYVLAPAIVVAAAAHHCVVQAHLAQTTHIADDAHVGQV